MERWRAIDAAPLEEARGLLRICCGSERWIGAMLRRRPFGSASRAAAAAREAWFGLAPADWHEAFAHHPRIGDIDGLRRRFAATRSLSEREQSGVTGASPDVLDALHAANREYEERFGYIFIVCAAGKDAAGMLELLRARLANSPQQEILVAAEEHARICERRLLAPDPTG